MAIQQLLQSKQGGIPPQMMALLELEQAKQALMQSGVAPGTVAGQKVQEAQMLTQPPQQPGMQDLMPGVQQRAGEMAQAQQPVTQAQLRQAMAQQTQQSQQPVMAAEGGIITLPADIEMAEGGIVGYNGETGSAVKLLNPEFDEEGLPRSKDERERIIDYNERLKSAYQRRAEAQATQAQAAAATAPRPVYPEEAKRRLEQFYRFGPRGSGGITADAATPADTSVPMRMQDTRGGTPEMAALAQMLGSGAAPNPAPSSRPPAAPAAAPAASGVASLMGPMMPSASDVEYGRQKAAIQQMLEAAQKPTEESPQDKALRTAREAEIARQTGAIDAARQRFTESQEKQKSQDLINFLMGVSGASSLFGGMARSGQQLSQVQAAREAERIKYMDLLDTRNEAVGRLKLAQLTGDADLARESAKELRKTTMDIQRLSVDLGGRRMADLAREESEAVKTAAQSRENALERASREKMEGMRLKQQAEQTGQMQLANRINAANMTVAAAIEKMDKDLDKKYGQLLSFKKMMPPDQFNKNAGYVEEYQRYLKEYDEKYKIAVEPAVKERDRLAAMITAGQDLSKWGEPQVKTGR